jgi:four helix bundle protein
MTNGNIVQLKSFEFAIRIVNLSKFLRLEHKEYVISKQILRSGTSIGANIEEAIGAQSKKDFLAKTSIAYKEARETNYWLRLLLATNYIDKKLSNSLLKDCNELIRIITSIQKTTKTNLKAVHH